MKICTECKYSDQQLIETPQGHQYSLVCKHQECRDPVEGSPIPCNFARREVAFCGVQGKYWVAKEDIEDAKIISIVRE